MKYKLILVFPFLSVVTFVTVLLGYYFTNLSENTLFIPIVLGTFFSLVGLVVLYMLFGEIEALHREYEERISKYQKENTEGRNVLTDEFIATASHNFRTPISELKGYLDLLSSENIFAEQRILYVHKMQAILQRLYELVQNMLTISVSVQKRKVNFVNIVRNVVASIESDSKMKNLNINLKSISDSIQVNADPILLTTAIENVLSNAIKYSNTDSEINVNLDVQDKRAVLSISNVGVGIPKDEIPNLFTKFHRAQNVLMTYQGTGLGLYITKEIISKHEGDIRVESEEGKTTTFTIYIPISQ